MSSRVVPSGKGHLAIPLHSLHGKPLDSIQVYQTEEVLTLDLRFEDGHALELLFGLGFKASANVLRYVNGDAMGVRKLNLKQGK